MIELRDKENGSHLGSISEEDLKFLIDNLEEESDDDTDYYLTLQTLELLKARGASTALTQVLESALGGGDDVEIEWSEGQ